MDYGVSSYDRQEKTSTMRPRIFIQGPEKGAKGYSFNEERQSTLLCSKSRSTQP